MFEVSNDRRCSSMQSVSTSPFHAFMSVCIGSGCRQGELGQVILEWLVTRETDLERRWGALLQLLCKQKHSRVSVQTCIPFAIITWKEEMARLEMVQFCLEASGFSVTRFSWGCCGVCWSKQSKQKRVVSSHHHHPHPFFFLTSSLFIFLLHLLPLSSTTPSLYSLPSACTASSSPSLLLSSGGSMMQWFIAAVGTA